MASAGAPLLAAAPSRGAVRALLTEARATGAALVLLSRRALAAIDECAWPGDGPVLAVVDDERPMSLPAARLAAALALALRRPLVIVLARYLRRGAPAEAFLPPSELTARRQSQAALLSRACAAASSCGTVRNRATVDMPEAAARKACGDATLVVLAGTPRRLLEPWRVGRLMRRAAVPVVLVPQPQRAG